MTRKGKTHEYDGLVGEYDGLVGEYDGDVGLSQHSRTKVVAIVSDTVCQCKATATQPCSAMLSCICMLSGTATHEYEGLVGLYEGLVGE